MMSEDKEGIGVLAVDMIQYLPFLFRDLSFVVAYLNFSLLFGARQKIVTVNYSISVFFNLQT